MPQSRLDTRTEPQSIYSSWTSGLKYVQCADSKSPSHVSEAVHTQLKTTFDENCDERDVPVSYRYVQDHLGAVLIAAAQ